MLEKMKEIIAEQLSVDADSITEASSFKHFQKKHFRKKPSLQKQPSS